MIEEKKQLSKLMLIQSVAKHNKKRILFIEIFR
jgi:hypothetical protein